MFEDFANAFNNFKANKTRTILSLLGVIIGVAAVIIITSMGASSTQQVKNTFGTTGLDIISINKSAMRGFGNTASIDFNESFRDELFENVKDIEKVWYKNSLSGTFAYNGTTSSVNVAAVEAGYLEMYNLKLESGNYFGITDDVEGTQTIILSHDLAKNYFPAGDAVGKTITIIANDVTFSFKVIGVLAKQTTGMENSSAYVPRGFYTKKINPDKQANSVMVQATSPEKATDVQNGIEAYCMMKTRSEHSVSITSMQTMLDQMSQITKTMSMMLSAIAAISLLVGGIGIMNIMIVTVTERKQEIGIRKALGATPRAIKQQFLIESASITLTGGFLGVIVGIILSLAIEYVQGLAYMININACFIAFIFSVVVGVFFGLNPASRAAKLDPVIALSGE